MITTKYIFPLINPFHSIFINKINWITIFVISKTIINHDTESIIILNTFTATTCINTLIIRIVGMIKDRFIFETDKEKRGFFQH